MSRYIDADKAIEKIFDMCKFYPRDGTIARTVIGMLPTADVEEIRHAYWKRQPGKDPNAFCSVCGREAVYQIIDGKWAFENFCPHCGAKMDCEDNV